MSDLIDKNWEEYLAKCYRDILWRAIGEVRSAQASLAILDNMKLRDACAAVGDELELELKKRYEETK